MAKNSARSDDAVPTCHGQPAPHVDEAQLAASRHACHIVRDVCTFNATLFPRKPVNEKVRSLQVRSPSYSHHSLALHEWFGLKPAIAGSQAAALVRRRLRRHGYSACVPLIWLPVWALNFYETMQNSVPPLHEMLVTTRALDRRVLLRPDLGHSVWWWRRPKYIDALLQPFSTHSVRMLREVAPVCLPHQAEATLRRDDNHTRRCATECFSQLVVCSPKSVFDEDRFAQPSSPYRAAQYVAARHLNGEGTAEAANAGATAGAEAPAAAPAAAGRAWPTLRVLFVNRTVTATGRAGKRDSSKENIHNLPHLLSRCHAHPTLRLSATPSFSSPPPPPGNRAGFAATGFGAPLLTTAATNVTSVRRVRLACAVHAFGRKLAEDIRRVRRADVLVGTHGAALSHALFMERGASLVEVRAYGFEGRWADAYMKKHLRAEDAIFHFHVGTATPALMHPRPPPDVKGWTARDNRAVELPWRTLAQVLRTVVQADRSVEAYRSLPSRSFWSRAPDDSGSILEYR